MKAHLKEREDLVRYPDLANLRQVVARFRDRFGLLERKRRAQARFEVLRQGDQSTRSYVAAFERLEEDAEFGDEALIQAFRRGLDGGLRKKIDALANRPTTVAAWKAMALSKDASYRADQEEEKAWNNPFRKSSAPLPKTDATGSSQTNTPIRVQAGQMTEEERMRHIRGGLCFRCHTHGHLSRDCPEKGKGKEKAKDDGTSALIARLLAMGGDEKAKVMEALKDF